MINFRDNFEGTVLGISKGHTYTLRHDILRANQVLFVFDAQRTVIS